MNASARAKRGSNRRWRRWALAIVLAAATVVLWTTVDRRGEKEVTVSPVYVNLADDLLVSDTTRPLVRLLLSGRSLKLNRIDPDTVRCRIDLAGLGPGSHLIELSRATVQLPQGVGLSALLTQSVTVALERRLPSKEVEVIAVLAGQPAPGFAVTGVSVHPDHILLTGPASKLVDIETVRTRPIELESASESFKKEIPLMLPESVPITPSPSIVVAEVDVTERVVTRVIEKRPVLGKGPVAGYQIEPPTIDLILTGPEEILKTIESDPSFTATVDLTGLLPGTHVLKAAINLPVRVRLIQATPQEFEVRIAPAGAATRTDNREPPTTKK